MSNGPTLISQNVVVEQNYVNVILTPKDWCSFNGKCKINQVILHEKELCNKCKYKKEIDIPNLLEKLMRKENE